MMVRLEPEAFGILNGIRRDANALVKSSRGLAAGWHGKTPARALRLALVFEYLTWALVDDEAHEPAAISARAMAYAGEFLDFAGKMLERVLAGLLVEQADADAATVATLLVEERPTIINERALYQRRGFHFLRPTDRRRLAFKRLAEANFLRPKLEDTGGRPAGNWLVNPRLGAAR